MYEKHDAPKKGLQKDVESIVEKEWKPCVDYEAGFRVAACVRNLVDVFFIVDEHSFALKLVCQG